MAVAYDNSITTDDFGVTGLTTGSFTIAGANRAACLGLTSLGVITNETVLCGTVAGAKITNTELTLLSGGVTFNTMLFSVIAPLTGSRTASAAWTTATSASLGAVTLTGVDQTTPANNGVTKTSTGTASISQAITSNSGDRTVSLYSGGGSDGAATSNQTKRTSDFGALDTGGGTGTTTHIWSHAAEDMMFSGANFAQVASATATYVARSVVRPFPFTPGSPAQR